MRQCFPLHPITTSLTKRDFINTLKAVAGRSPLPVILYNVPSRTGVNISPETVLRLAQDFDNVVAVKEAAGDFQQAQTLINICPKNFSVLSGDDEMSLSMILAGAKGVISVIGNAIPNHYSNIIHKGLRKGWMLHTISNIEF